MNRSVRILIAVGALAALVGAYFIVKNIPKKQSASASSTSTQITNLKESDLQKVVLKHDGTTLTLDRKNDKFVPEYQYPIQLDDGAIGRVTSDVVNVYANRIVEESPTDLAKYGLANPAGTVEATLKDGKTLGYKIGNKTPSGDGYYFQKDGEKRVVIVGSYAVQPLLFSLNDIRDTSLPSPDTKKLEYLKMVTQKHTIEIIPTPKDMKSEEANLSTMVMIQPYKVPRPVASDKLSNLMKDLSGFSIDTFVNDNPSNLAQYGLSPAKEHLVVKDDKTTLDLLIGDSAPSGGVYAKTPSSPGVFTITNDLSFMDTTPFDLVDKFALIINIDKVDKMQIVTPGKTYNATITRTGSGKDQKATYTLDGKDIKEDYFKHFYQDAIGILYDAENPAPTPGKPAITISYTLNTDGNPTLSVNFVPFNDNFYQVYRNGISEFLVTRQQMQGVISAAQTTVQGNDPGTP